MQSPFGDRATQFVGRAGPRRVDAPDTDRPFPVLVEVAADVVVRHVHPHGVDLQSQHEELVDVGGLHRASMLGEVGFAEGRPADEFGTAVGPDRTAVAQLEDMGVPVGERAIGCGHRIRRPVDAR
ncbi:hypothetical protein nbrc107696_22470 [Gordonia spumicola]|uniref:Uncharacterized protein n=1 Tax=Gordonia spumicola TaxID=589161 RepID=A0A7I9V8J9_9ACTN|nr:hypothetical protein nbrc107696_20910 [Gordonia spumicola]GEE01801.1 hypothetical protein nbrc107696_22470 [Gordonia spumicola]